MAEPPTPPAATPSAAETKVLAGTDGATRASALPAHFPAWAGKLAELYFSGTTSTFILHGNVQDVVRAGTDAEPRYVGLAEFLAEQLFGRWDLVLHYDLARGLRCLAGTSSKRLQEMVTTVDKWLGDLRAIKRDPVTSLAALDLFVQKNIMADPDKRVRCAIVIDHAGYVAPRGDRLSLQDQTAMVTLLNWASSPYVKRLNLAFVLIEGQLSNVSERLASSPHVASVDVPLPDAPQRTAFLAAATRGREVGTFSDYSIDELGKLTAGIGLTDLEVLVRSSIEGGRRLDATLLPRAQEAPDRAPGAGLAGVHRAQVRPGAPWSATMRRRSACWTMPRSSSAAAWTSPRWAICSTARSAPARPSSPPASPVRSASPASS
jgi:hypothetical protein